MVPGNFVFRRCHFNEATFLTEYFCNWLNSHCASFREKKNEIGSVVFVLISIIRILGAEKIALSLKLPQGQISKFYYCNEIVFIIS